MFKSVKVYVGVVVLAIGISTGAWAAGGSAVSTYQVTGPVLEVTDAKIVVQKGAEKWEIIRDANTTVTGDLKVGAKVTIKYKMTATTVEVK